MKALDHFSLPLKSTPEGTKILEFVLDRKFFQLFENELVGECEIIQKTTIERRSDLIILHLTHDGTMQADCDRCLEPIKIPVYGERRFVIKFVDEVQEDEDEILYILRDQDKFDLSVLINEVVTLSLPLVKIYDCESDPDAPCNKEVLKYLKTQPSQEVPQVWDQLKNLKLED
ncbi:MAG: DUF177 domain-containing protein [Saprospiraceae bacterium]|nr:DUF177 domain-containing protein [Saprospiraceae bacterium]